jgi:hypothetical protein
MNTLIPETTDKIGGKSMEDDIPTNRIRASRAIPSNSGKRAEGQGRQTKSSMKNPGQKNVEEEE